MGTEHLRLIPTKLHLDPNIDIVANSLVELWRQMHNFADRCIAV